MPESAGPSPEWLFETVVAFQRTAALNAALNPQTVVVARK
jgi:hypothetical protein